MAFLEKLPRLPVIELWKFEYAVNGGDKYGAFVPDIIEYNGKLYMYAYVPLMGIVSYSGNDGKQWVKDAGLRVQNPKDLIYSHPYAAIAPDGKLYLFMETMIQGVLGKCVSFSESPDGLNFTTPQTILRGEDFGGTHAAHGRIMKLIDGKYLIAVSTAINGRGPSPGTGILYSSDLKIWNFSSIYFAGCHDPTLDVVSGGIRLYCSNLGKETVRFDSPDGYQWEPQNPVGLVGFLNQDGTVIDTGDVDVHTFQDGTKRIFISVQPTARLGEKSGAP